MIGNIRDCTSEETLRVYTNGGSNNFTSMAPLKFLPMEKRFNQDSMVNILSISDVASIPGVHISMN